MSGFDDWRESYRLTVHGQAFWSTGRQEGRCTLIDLSAGGVRIEGPVPSLKVGTRLHVALQLGDLCLERVPVEVIRMSDDTLGLEFRKLSSEHRARVEELIKQLIAAG